MWEPTNRPQAKKCREAQRKVGKFLGSSSIVRHGDNVTTTKEIKYPTQRKYPGNNTTIGSSSIITEKSTVTADCKVKTHTQREYPHGRKLGYSNVKMGDDGANLRAGSTDSVLSQRSSIREKRQSTIYGRENRNPLVAGANEEVVKRKVHTLAANSESMKQPLKPVPPARTYPHGQNQMSSKLPITFNEKAPRDPKPQPRTYPHGQNQFSSHLTHTAEPSQGSDSTSKKVSPKSRTYSHGGGLGVQSTQERNPVRRFSSSRFLSSKTSTSNSKGNGGGRMVDPNEILQKCIQSRRQEQQFNHSNVKISNTHQDVTTSSLSTKPNKTSRVGQCFGLSSIATLMSSATSKIVRPNISSRKSFTNRSHSQTLGFSRIQLG